MALLERETLEGEEALAILQSHGVTMEDPLRRRVADERLRGSRRPGSFRGVNRGLDSVACHPRRAMDLLNAVIETG